jgi:hypothetical protein
MVISVSVFASFEVAMLSTAMITLGSLYSYRNMIRSKVGEIDVDGYKDTIDSMDDPYDLYEEERELEITDVKEMIKEEKKHQKQATMENTVKNISAMVSVYRLLPYAFFVIGFIVLQNNHMLQLLAYLVGLAYGIVMGYLLAREWLI